MSESVVFYVYDPLCAWSYGFSQNMFKFWDAYKEQVQFKVLTGGMVLSPNEGPVQHSIPSFSKTIAQVSATTKAEFGTDFLQTVKEGTAYFSSLPGALAMAVFRYLQPDQLIPFSKSVQDAIFKEGKLPIKPDTYGYCAEQFGMDAGGFMTRMVEKELVEQVHNEFKLVREWGISSFPVVIIIQDEKAYQLAKGYCSFEELEENFKNFNAQLN